MRADADRARSQANESATATEAAKEEEGTHKFEASETLKKLRREAARLIHPDTVLDDREKKRHHEWMAKVNEVFDERDEKRLQQILNEWESSPESVKGEGIAVDLVRAIRKIALVEQRLTILDKEILFLEASHLYKLKSKAEEAEAEGRELLGEIAAAVENKISDAKNRLEQVLKVEQ